MKVYDLCCELHHQFEGWFGSEADFHAQLARDLIECPICGSAQIEKRPSAPRLNLSRATAPREADGKAADPVAQQAAMLALARKVLENTEDVGEQFAEEARRIHYKDAPERAIRGVATREERDELAEEGIEVLPLPIPAALKETLQ